MKCGTSTLHEQLACRSGLFLSEPKEPNFFSDDNYSERGLAAYTHLFGEARPDQLCGESSTHYTKLPTYPKSFRNIFRHAPRARLIYVMRHPIDRIVSQYVHEWTQLEVRDSFDVAVRKHERYVAYSSYARQLLPFLEHWGSDRILPVCFERMIARREDELSRICNFLGDTSHEPVHWDPTRGEQNVSRDRMRKSPLRDRLLDVPALRWVKDRIPQAGRDWVKSHWQMTQRPELPPEVLRAVESELDNDLAVLGTWLGVRLSCTTWKATALEDVWRWHNPPSPASATQGEVTG